MASNLSKFVPYRETVNLRTPPAKNPPLTEEEIARRIEAKKLKRERQHAKQCRRAERRVGVGPRVARAFMWLKTGVVIGGPRYDKDFVQAVGRAMQ